MRSSSTPPLLRKIRSFAALTFALALALALFVTGIGTYRSISDGKARMAATLNSFNDLFLEDYFKQVNSALDILTDSFVREAAMAGTSVATPEWKTVEQILPGHLNTFFYNIRTENIEIHPEYLLPSNFQPQDRPWYALTEATTPTLGHIWVPPYEDFFHHTRVITIARQIYSPKGEFLGILAIDMNVDIISQKLRKALDAEDTNFYVFSDGTLALSVINGGTEIATKSLATYNEQQAAKGAFARFFDISARWETADPQLTFVVTTTLSSLLKSTLYFIPFYLLPVLLAFVLFYVFMLRLARRLIVEQQGLSSALRNLGKNPETFLHAKDAFFLPLDELSIVAMQIESQDEKINQDSLTKVYSRHKFESDYALMLGGNDDFYLLMMDVDNFKTVNDTFGHLVGDNVLRRIATTLRLTGGSKMRAYRFGGDEFCAILEPDMDIVDLCAVLCEKIYSTQWREEGLAVSISIGVARFKEVHTKDDPGSALMNLADTRLYISKSRGKNGFSFTDEV